MKVDPYESQLKRPYFHVKTLESSELSAWETYLTYAEKEQDQSVVIKLYNRCLVAAAYYPKYWLKFTKYLEGVGKVDEARSQFKTATTLYLTKKPTVFREYAAFEERHGNTEEARRLYQHILTTVAPGLLQAIIDQVNFERRNGNTQTEAAYQAGLDHYEEKSKENDEKKNNRTALRNDEFAFLSMHYARYLYTQQNNDKASAVYAKAVELAPTNATLWLARIQFEESQSGDVEATVAPLYEKALTATASQSEVNKTLWQLFVSFMQTRSADLKAVQEVERRHAEYRTTRASTSSYQGRKRKTSNGHDGYNKHARTGSYNSSYGHGGGGSYYGGRSW